MRYLTKVREKVDYLTMRLDTSQDFVRWLDTLVDNSPRIDCENIPFKFVLEHVLEGKLKVVKMYDLNHNSVGQVTIAYPHAQGFYTELHLQGNFWFCYDYMLCEVLDLFGLSLNTNKGIVRLDYAIDVSEYQSVLDECFNAMPGNKSMHQADGAISCSWMRIRTKRLDTVYYNKKLDIVEKKEKYDLVDVMQGTPYRDYFNAHERITRIEQRRNSEALKPAKGNECKPLGWYLDGNLSALTHQDLRKKGICFFESIDQKIKYDKRMGNKQPLYEMDVADTKLLAKKKNSSVMFNAYVKNMYRYGMVDDMLEILLDNAPPLEVYDLLNKKIEKLLTR